jgi:hypothetical protein
MLLRRLLVAIISLAIGTGATILIIVLIGTTPAEYGPTYTFFTALSLSIAAGIWLDKFLRTNILPK